MTIQNTIIKVIQSFIKTPELLTPNLRLGSLEQLNLNE